MEIPADASNTASNTAADACPRCGKPVHCGMNSGRCWCADFPPALAMPSDGQGCYCRDCLTEIIAGMKPPAEK